MTVHVRDPDATEDESELNKKVKYRLEALDLANNPFPNNQIPLGSEFKVRAYADDIRVPDAGVFSGYIDVLYDTRHVSIIPSAVDEANKGFKIDFSEDYPAARQAIEDIPGIIDEAGAVQSDTAMALGGAEVPLFDVFFTADRLGRADFFADPVEDLPLHETSVWDNLPPNETPEVVSDLNDFLFLDTTIFIVPSQFLAAIELEAVDMNGNLLPNGQVVEGQEFQLVVKTDDRRSPPDASHGLFSAYADISFDPSIVSPLTSTTHSSGFDVTFDADYPEARNIAFNLGEIDEVGAAGGIGATPLGPDPEELVRITFTADDLGQVTFSANPADDQSLHQTTLQLPNQALSNAQIAFGATTVTVVSQATDFTNALEPLDVNNDGGVSPLDALIIINYLNQHGIGTPIETDPRQFWDTNGDGIVSALDVLRVINRLNDDSNFEEFPAAGEGEADLAAARAPFIGPKPLHPMDNDIDWLLYEVDDQLLDSIATDQVDNP